MADHFAAIDDTDDIPLRSIEERLQPLIKLVSRRRTARGAFNIRDTSKLERSIMINSATPVSQSEQLRRAERVREKDDVVYFGRICIFHDDICLHPPPPSPRGETDWKRDSALKI